MPRGVKRPAKRAVFTGRGSWKRDRPIIFEDVHGYLWVGEVCNDGSGMEKFLFALSAAETRKLARMLGGDDHA